MSRLPNTVAGGIAGKRLREAPAGSADRSVYGRRRRGHDEAMSVLGDVEVPPRPVAQLEQVIGRQRYERLLAAAADVRQGLAGRTVWNVNSTAVGGGVAEMLQCLVGYVLDLRIPIRWLVISGDAEFFTITKRLHNHLHGDVGDGGPLDGAAARHYAQVLEGSAAELVGRVQPGEVVLLHDPQTAGLAAPLAAAGARVVWRCHIGLDGANDATRAGWEFLRPHLAAAHAYVFSRAEYVPRWLPAGAVRIIPPSIDPFSAKNQELDTATVHAILATMGVLDGGPREPGRFVRRDGSAGRVTRPAAVVADQLPDAGEGIVLQVSRWDRLKDMAGVMRGFVEHVAPGGNGRLVLAGPAVSGVSDDPEGAAVYAECVAYWRALPAAVRARVLLVTLPLADVDENAAMVNALQRQARVVAQKSLAEGFGLTVAEAMWKGRAVIGSAVGGIRDQIVDGTGVLLPDPTDLAAFGAVVRRLLDDAGTAAGLGTAAQAYVRDAYVGDLHLRRYAELLGTLL
jgi:trehalose synthase